MSKTTVTASQIKHIAQLANIPVTDQESQQLAEAFVETLEVVNKLQQLDTDNIEPTHQVTGLTNVLREDKVDSERTFTQKQALANAEQTYQGYFIVPRLIDKS